MSAGNAIALTLPAIGRAEALAKNEKSGSDARPISVLPGLEFTTAGDTTPMAKKPSEPPAVHRLSSELTRRRLQLEKHAEPSKEKKADDDGQDTGRNSSDTTASQTNKSQDLKDQSPDSAPDAESEGDQSEVLSLGEQDEADFGEFKQDTGPSGLSGLSNLMGVSGLGALSKDGRRAGRLACRASVFHTQQPTSRKSVMHKAGKRPSARKSVALTLSQKLFKAAKKSKDASTKDAFAVLCFDEGDGDQEVVEAKDRGCRRFFSTCTGVTPEKLMSDVLDASVVESIKACFDRIVKKAGSESIAGISCDVGYLWMKHQRILRQVFPDLPVLTTPMVQLPFIWTCFGTNDRTLLVTWKDDADDSKEHHLSVLETAGIRLDHSRLEILTLDVSDPHWSLFLAGMTTQSENQKLVNQMVNMVHNRIIQLFDKGVDVNSIMLDSVLSKFSEVLGNATDLPVFDEVSMLKLFTSASSLSHFSDASVLCRLQDKKSRDGQKKDAEKGTVGLIQLEYEYVAAVGDIDHGSTFQFKSCPEVVPGLTFEEAQRGSQKEQILENLKRAVDRMEAEECFGITGNCGFMHFYQQFVRDYATVPVFMSALVQVPAMAATLEPDERILVLTASETSFMESRDALLSAEGRPFCDFNRILVRGCENVPGFEAVANAEQVDTIKVQQHLQKYVKEILQEEKESEKGPIKLILLECTELPHYAAALRRCSGLPVFDVVTSANFFAHVLVCQE